MSKAHRRGPESHRVTVRRGGSHRRHNYCAGSAANQNIFEPLEDRVLFHNEGGFAAAINFQPSSASVPDGYYVDSGSSFGSRSNGLTYGWNGDNSSLTRDRNYSTSPDQRYDTLIHFAGMQAWEMSVENGTYEVHLVAGDPKNIDSNYQITVEGKTAISGKPTSSNHWLEADVVAEVTDGKLTISSGSGADNNKLAFIEITSIELGDHETPAPAGSGADGSGDTDTVSGTSTTTTSPTIPANFLATKYSSSAIALVWDDKSSNESGFKIERRLGTSGSWSQIATVGANVESYNDTGLPSSTHYDYRNRSYNSAGNSAYTRIDGSTTDAGSSTTPTPPTVGDANGISKITWATKASAPNPVDDSLGVAANGKLYVLGGMNSSGVVLRADRYNPSTNSWERLPNPPERITHAQPVVSGNYIYLVGGYVGTGNGFEQIWATKHVWRFDTVNLKWSAMPDLPIARGGGAATLVGSKIHFFGGVDVSRADKNDHFVLDLNNTGAGWKTAAAMPNARSHHAAAYLNGKVYIIGGQHGFDGNATLLKDVNVYDPATDKWTTAASLPAPRSHIICSTFVLNGRIVAIGGDFNSPGARTSDVTMYNPSTNSWSRVSQIPSSRLACVVGVIDGSVYVTVGSNQSTTWKGTVS